MLYHSQRPLLLWLCFFTWFLGIPNSSYSNQTSYEAQKEKLEQSLKTSSNEFRIVYAKQLLLLAEKENDTTAIAIYKNVLGFLYLLEVDLATEAKEYFIQALEGAGIPYQEREVAYQLFLEGLLSLKNQETKKAIQHIELALDKLPDDFPLRREINESLAQVYSNSKDFDQCIKYFLRTKPKDSPLNLHEQGIFQQKLGLIYWDAQKEWKAMQCMKEALNQFEKEDPTSIESIDTLNYLAQLWMKKDLRKAWSYWDEGIKRSMKKGTNYFVQLSLNKAVTQINDKKYTSAYQTLTQAINHKKKGLQKEDQYTQEDRNELIELYRYCSYITFLSKNFDRAEYYLLTILHLITEENPSYHLLKDRFTEELIHVYIHKKDFHQALQEAYSLIDHTLVEGKVTSNTISTINAIGMLFYSGNAYEQAGELFKAAVKQYELLPQKKSETFFIYLNNQGCAYLNQKKYIEAASCFKKSIKQLDEDEVSPPLLVAYMHLAVVSTNLGNHIEAKEYMQKIRKFFEQLPEENIDQTMKLFIPGIHLFIGEDENIHFCLSLPYWLKKQVEKWSNR